MTTEKFNHIKTRFLTAFWNMFPLNASNIGLHEYDGQISDLSQEKINEWLNFLKTIKKELKSVDPNTLERKDQLDYYTILRKIELDIFNIEEIQSYTENPLSYLFQLNTAHYLLRDYAPLEVRVKAIIEHFRKIPKFLETAKQQLSLSVAAPFLEIAERMLQGYIHFYTVDTFEEVKKLSDEALIKDYEDAMNTAVQAIKDFLEHIERNMKPQAHDNFALGKERYEKLIALSNFYPISAEKLLEIAMDDLKKNYTKIKEVCKQIDPNKTVKEIIESIKKNHPTPEKLIPETEAMLEEIRQWIIDHNFVTIPSEERCKVIPTPSFYRNFAFAAMATPGPYEEKATDAFYFVSEPDPKWPEEKKEQWMTIFAYPALRDISVHEAYPGHYVQFLYLNKNKLLSAIFWDYANTEGWAHYVEEAMLEHGFYKDDLEYQVAVLIEALIRNVRFVSSVRLHTDPDFKLEDSVKLFMEYAFMERTTAEEEARRGTYDPGYLNYTLGKLMIKKLRQDLEKKLQGNFSLQKFHDEFLELGSVPIPIIRKHFLGTTDGVL